MDGPGAADGHVGLDDGRPAGRLRNVLERRAGWIEALVVLTTIAAAFVVLGFLARYFQDYFRLILIFFFAWLLAFLISPVADLLQRRLTRLPRGLAVVAVIVPVILISAVIIVRALASISDSFAQLVASLPDLAAHPPTFVADLQTWFDERGIAVDVAGSFHSIVTDLLKGMADLGRRDPRRLDRRREPRRLHGHRPRRHHAPGP